ncbi:nitrogenase component 1 [Geomonas subterranea]|uniref:nitrogenase component 1 n=1 Tax=Geomonas subterranea TaxID=2847989 RepID=UPI001CD53BC4|nr:nitrogenase component 1 [Geomonas fuzhouensis]
MNGFVERPRFSCTLGGALSTVTAIHGTVPIVHAAAGCGGNLFTAQLGGSGYYGSGYCGGLSAPGSNVSEHEIVFGGEERLAEQIRTTLEIMEGECYVVLTGCMTDIIGDDIRSAVQEFRGSGAPVAGVETGGFKGTSYKGYDLALSALFRQVVAETDERATNRVNLWGLVPGLDPFFRGDLLELQRLLALVGVQASTFFAPGEGVRDLVEAGKAAANIVVSQPHGIAAAEAFRERFGTPYLALELPIGPSASARFLRQVAEFLGLDGQLVKRVIERETADYYRFVERVADFYCDTDLQHYVAVVGNATSALPFTRFLAEDLGWLPSLVVVTDNLPDQERSRIALSLDSLPHGGKPALVFETDASVIAGHLTRAWRPSGGERYQKRFAPAFVLGSTLEQEPAAAVGARHLSVSYPVFNRVIVNRGYAGFHGALHLVEDLLSTYFGGA